MKVDLHIHSNFSDSSRSPEEIVSLAKNRNASILAICDHSTIDAFSRFSNACIENRMTPILGVELAANYNGENFHVLAYNFDINDSNFREFIKSQHDKSEAECEKIIANMSVDYPQMSVEDYVNYQPPHEKGGWKYIYYIVHKGVAFTYEEASYFFGKYFEPDPRTFELCDFCSVVTKVGGVPILAHPGYVYDRNPDYFIDFLTGMTSSGIAGVECYYPSHSKECTRTCIDFCKKNNLRITGGCDCHGEYDKSPGFTIASLDISLSMLDLKGIL